VSTSNGTSFHVFSTYLYHQQSLLICFLTSGHKSCTLEWVEHYNLLYLCYVTIYVQFTIQREQEYHQMVLLQSQSGSTKYKEENTCRQKVRRQRNLPVRQNCVCLRWTVYPIKSLNIILCMCEFSTY
jgi:hypothetical protein